MRAAGLRLASPGVVHLVAATIAALLFGPACSPELAQLECVDNTNCGAGEVCRGGRCVAVGPGDVTSDPDADPPDDSSVDTPPDTDLDANRDAGDLADADAPADADLTELPDGDLTEEDAAPDFPCPPEVDCLDGVDSDLDGTDGQAGAVILVDAVNGTPAGDGTLAQPVSTLARALEIASLQPTRNQILLADARYTLAETLEVVGPLSLFEIGGGYDADSWSRTGDRAQLIGTGPGANPVLRFADVGEVRLSQLDVAAPQGAAGTAGEDDGEASRAEATAGQTSIAVSAANATLLVLDSTLTAGDGGVGARGRLGRTGADGVVGGNAPEPSGAARPGGIGATGPLCFDGRPAPRGGSGAPGDGTGTAADGEPGDGPAGGAGGDLDDEPTGGEGGPGEAGGYGIGGGIYGYIRGGTWHAVPGSPGEHGRPGSGGGGGSSGFDADGEPSDPGGGGGSGACGGEGGGGGSGGGGSIGLYLEDADAFLDHLVRVQAGDGGDGQHGGSGGSGGTGQGGGAGWEVGVDETSGYDGGPGGNGGIGQVGGGGAGGVSVAVVLVGTAQVSGGILTFGTGGFGGLRPDAEDEPTNPGRRGYAGEALVFRGLEPNGACRYGAAPVVDDVCPAPDGSPRSLCVDLTEAVERAVLAPLSPDPDPEDPVGQAIAIPARLPWVSLSRADATVACARGGGVVCDGHVLADACERSAGPADACNFASGALSQTALFCFNADGLFDLLGNAAEWVAPGCTGDFEDGDTYGGSFVDTPAEPDACETRGSASAPSPLIGFRCCSDPALLESMEHAWSADFSPFAGSRTSVRGGEGAAPTRDFRPTR